MNRGWFVRQYNRIGPVWEEAGNAEVDGFYRFPSFEACKGERCQRGYSAMSTDGGRAPRWSFNGGEIFFRSPDDHLMAALVTRTGDSVRLDKPRVWYERVWYENRLAGLGGPRTSMSLRTGNTSSLCSTSMKRSPTKLAFVCSSTSMTNFAVSGRLGRAGNDGNSEGERARLFSDGYAVVYEYGAIGEWTACAEPAAKG